MSGAWNFTAQTRFPWNTAEENGLLLYKDCVNLRRILQRFMKSSKLNCNRQTTNTSCKGERTAIQYLNRLPFWSHKGEEGIDTLGELSYDRDCHENNMKLRPQKTRKCHFKPQFILPPPCPFASPLRATKAWDRPRLPHLVHINELLDKSDLRIWSGRASSRSFMTCRLGYWTSDYGLHWCRAQRTSLTNVGHLGQETSGKSAILGNDSTGNYLLSVHGVILGLRSV